MKKVGTWKAGPSVLKAQARRGAIIFWLLLLFAGSIWGQLISTRAPFTAHAQILLHLDQLEDSWELKQARSIAKRKGSAPGIDADRPLPDDHKLKLQLQMIEGKDMEFGLYPRVREFIRMYAQQKRGSMEAIMGLSKAYFPILEKQLQSARLPRNLKYLPIVLSALNVRGIAEQGNSGLWQLNYHTAMRYGLRCDQEIDERRDPVKSTATALAYLKHLYDKYEDWMLTIAAFTCGPGGVTIARNRVGKAAGFEQLYPHLPEYGRDYVPAFIAAVYVMTYHRLLGLEALAVPVPTKPDQIRLDQPLDFAPIAKVLGLPVQQLQAINPMCRTVKFPGDDEEILLCLPRGYGGTFDALKDSIFAMQARNSAPSPPPVEKNKPIEERTKPLPEKNELKKPVKVTFEPPENSSKLLYTIKAGDNLGAIARWYGISLAELKGWNGLENDRIRAGDQLKIYVGKDKAPKLREVDQMTFEEKQVMIGEAKPAPEIPENAGGLEPGKYEYYTVKSGDNLWQIAQQHPGTSAEDIMQLNDITEDIKPGMRLKIRLKTK